MIDMQVRINAKGERRPGDEGYCCVAGARAACCVLRCIAAFVLLLRRRSRLAAEPFERY